MNQKSRSRTVPKWLISTEKHPEKVNVSKPVKQVKPNEIVYVMTEKELVDFAKYFVKEAGDSPSKYEKSANNNTPKTSRLESKRESISKKSFDKNDLQKNSNRKRYHKPKRQRETNYPQFIDTSSEDEIDIKNTVKKRRLAETKNSKLSSDKSHEKLFEKKPVIRNIKHPLPSSSETELDITRTKVCTQSSTNKDIVDDNYELDDFLFGDDTISHKKHHQAKKSKVIPTKSQHDVSDLSGDALVEQKRQLKPGPVTEQKTKLKPNRTASHKPSKSIPSDLLDDFIFGAEDNTPTCTTKTSKHVKLSKTRYTNEKQRKATINNDKVQDILDDFLFSDDVHCK